MICALVTGVQTCALPIVTLDAGDGRLLHVVDLVIGARRVDRELKRGAGFVQHRSQKLPEVRAGAEGVAATAEHVGQHRIVLRRLDRKSGVGGKRGSVRVDLGGGTIYKKKTK